MHPAPSVIVFTTFSGLGFGLLAWLGLGVPDVYGAAAFAFFFIGYALAVGGLISSTFHLGNKMNAIYAFSQWQTSWLSREGVMAIVTLVIFAPYAIGRIFFDTAMPALGWLGALFAMITVFTTSMIYAQLKTIPRWNMPLNPVLFLLYAITGGALLAGQVRLAGWLVLVLTVLQVIAWFVGDGRLSATGSDKGSATGLGRIGKVRMLESAHTSRNYILDEMVYVIGRKHVDKLRVIAALLIGAIPAVMLLILPASHVIGVLALALHIAGVVIGRWLFFAEAEHVVGLYYSRG